MTSQQGRRELGNRSVILFHPPTLSCQDSSATGGTLQGDERLITTLEEERVLARRGRAGEKKVIFSILLRPILRCFRIPKQQILPRQDTDKLAVPNYWYSCDIAILEQIRDLL